MSSLKAKDRVSLCSFTFSDGRRCRTPRAAKHPHFCFYHAQKEARARAAKKLGKDLAYFFSGDYVSGCDLSTALARLIPAVVRGDVKPRTARTVAYLAQTLMQAIHIGQHEYINAFGTDGWRNSIRNSVNGNYNHRFPPKPEPSALSAPPTNPPAESSQPQPVAVPPVPIAPAASAVPIALATPAAPSNPVCHSGRTAHSASRMVLRDEESAFSEPQPAAAIPAPVAHPACPEPRRDSERRAPSTPQPTPNRNTSPLHFDHNYRLLIDGKPF